MACDGVGTNLIVARPGTGADKAVVERKFGSIDTEVLMALPGYCGINVAERGRAPSGEARLTRAQVQHLLRRWVVEQHQHQPVRGRYLPGITNRAATPRELFEESVARTGRIRVPVDRTAIQELLPACHREIRHDGVVIGLLTYDSPVLDDYRGRTSLSDDGQWSFRLNLHDRSAVMFQDPVTARWHRIPWAHARPDTVPFDDYAVDRATRLVAQHGGDAEDPYEVQSVLATILDNLGVPTDGTIPDHVTPPSLTDWKPTPPARPQPAAEPEQRDRPERSWAPPQRPTRRRDRRHRDHTNRTTERTDA